MLAAPDGRGSVRVRPAGAVSRPDNASPATMTSGSPFDVVALVTSAGGLSALNQLLRVLPDDFDAALVVVQHLGGQRSYLAEILHRRSPKPSPAAQRFIELLRQPDEPISEDQPVSGLYAAGHKAPPAPSKPNGKLASRGNGK